MEPDKPSAASGASDPSPDDDGEEPDRSTEIYFDSDAAGDVLPVAPPTEGGAYDPSKDREKVRGRLAAGLVGLLAVLTVSALGGVLVGADAGDTKAVLEVTVPPVVALCGSAIGFYYASAPGRHKD